MRRALSMLKQVLVDENPQLAALPPLVNCPHRRHLFLIMPTLFKFLTVCALLAGAIFAGMYALATFVEPRSVDLSYSVPPSKLHRGDTR